MAKLHGEGVPRIATIHEYLDWTLTAQNADMDDELVSDRHSFGCLSRPAVHSSPFTPPESGLCRLPRAGHPAALRAAMASRELQRQPGGRQERSPARAAPPVADPADAWKASLRCDHPVRSWLSRDSVRRHAGGQAGARLLQVKKEGNKATGGGFLHGRTPTTCPSHPPRLPLRCMVEAIESICRVLQLRKLMLCSTNDWNVRNTWSHLGFQFTTDEEMESKWDIPHTDLVYLQVWGGRERRGGSSMPPIHACLPVFRPLSITPPPPYRRTRYRCTRTYLRDLPRSGSPS